MPWLPWLPWKHQLSFSSSSLDLLDLPTWDFFLQSFKACLSKDYSTNAIINGCVFTEIQTAGIYIYPIIMRDLKPYALTLPPASFSYSIWILYTQSKLVWPLTRSVLVRRAQTSGHDKINVVWHGVTSRRPNLSYWLVHLCLFFPGGCSQFPLHSHGFHPLVKSVFH